MPHYRIYFTTTEGHVTAPAAVIECDDDQEAIGKAAQFFNGRAVELWEGARFIVRFPSDASSQETLPNFLGFLEPKKNEGRWKCVENPTHRKNEIQIDGTILQRWHSLRVTQADMAVIVKAACLKLGSLVATSHSKRLVTISMKLGSIDESMTITVSVPNDGEEDDIYDLSFARARDIARHFCELPFEIRSEKTHHKQ